MKTKIFDIWYRLLSSYWFIPAVLVTLSIGLVFAVHYVDDMLAERGISLGWFLPGGIEGTRLILSTIAGSIITVAGVVFSITILVLSQSASQLGPQVIKSFMQDRSTQVALGTFVATFVYSLLMLATLRDPNGENQPQAGTALALILAIVSVAVLIHFIHSMARFVQINRLIAMVVKEMHASVGRISDSRQKPSQHYELEKQHRVPDDFGTRSRRIPTKKNGFLQSITKERLMAIAVENDLVLAIHYNPGEFIPLKADLAAAWPQDRVNERISRLIQESFLIGDERTTEQDIEFSIERLEMTAVRALSPGVNDLYTANIAIRWLGVVLGQLAETSLLDHYHNDKNERLRLITKPLKYSTFVDVAFSEIKHSANSPYIFISLLETIENIAKCTKTEDQREVLRQHAANIEFDSRQKLKGDDSNRVQAQYAATLKTIENAGSPTQRTG